MPNSLGYTWQMEFMGDKPHNNSIYFCTFNVIDDYNRELLDIDNGTSIPSLCVIRHLDYLAQCHGYHKKIHANNCSEFTSSAFNDWAAAHYFLLNNTKHGWSY